MHALAAIPAHDWTWKDFLHHLLALSGSLHSLFAFFLGGFVIAFRKFWQRIRENRAAAWPSADGEVQAATVKKQQGGCWVEVSYRYYARQDYHYGKYRRYFRRKADAESFAQSIRGRHLQVRYREDQPAESVLLEQDLRMTGVLQVG